jgi:predicted RNA binding protein YcfA (HicA-like mRNA interferase family)
VTGGEHQTKAVSPDGTVKVPIPEHKGKDIKIGALKSIEHMTGIKPTR